MRRRIVMAVLAIGAIGGFSAGFASLHAHHHACCGSHHEANASSEGPGAK